MYGTFGAPQAVCERGVIILFLWNGFAIQMRLPVYTCHQVVINVSPFTFRENNEACVYLLLPDWFAAARTLGNEIDSIMTVKTLVWRKVLVYCSTVNPNLLFRPYKQKRNLWNLQLFYDDIEKEENFLDTRDNSYKFRYFRFLALQNLQLKQPLNWLNSTL